MTEIIKIQKEIKETLTETVIGHICNKCDRTISVSDTLGFMNFVTISLSGGYGSKFGDGSYVEVGLCRDCSFEVLSPYAKYFELSGMDDPNSKDFKCDGFEDCPAKWCKRESPGCSDLDRKHSEE